MSQINVLWQVQRRLFTYGCLARRILKQGESVSRFGLRHIQGNKPALTDQSFFVRSWIFMSFLLRVVLVLDLSDIEICDADLPLSAVALSHRVQSRSL